jgi:hypothetical protein
MGKVLYDFYMLALCTGRVAEQKQDLDVNISDEAAKGREDLQEGNASTTASNKKQYGAVYSSV